MATRKKRTAIQTQYSRELSKLKRRIRETSRRGFSFTGNIPTAQTKKSIKQLESIRKNFYQYAEYRTDSGVISGTERRTQERREAAQKAQYGGRVQQAIRQELTRRYIPYNRVQNISKKVYENIEESVTEDLSKSLTEKDRIKKITDKELRKLQNREELPDRTYETLYQVRNLIDSYVPNEHWRGRYTEMKTTANQTIQKMLTEAISERGEGAIARIIEENSTRIMELVQAIHYDSGEEQMNMHIAEFGTLVTGQAMNIMDAIELQNAVYDETYTDEEYEDIFGQR